MATDALPPYARTVYDETLRSVFYGAPTIASMANAPNLVGHLEHHSPTTDGSFSICAANGKGVFISKALYDSIPAEHRPSLNTSYKPNVDTLNAGIMTSIGTTFIPFILMNKDTGERVRVILHAIVLPNLFMSMFIGVSGGQIISTSAWGRNGPVFGFNFGQGDNDLMYVQGVMHLV